MWCGQAEREQMDARVAELAAEAVRDAADERSMLGACRRALRSPYQYVVGACLLCAMWPSSTQTTQNTHGTPSWRVARRGGGEGRCGFGFPWGLCTVRYAGWSSLASALTCSGCSRC